MDFPPGRRTNKTNSGCLSKFSRLQLFGTIWRGYWHKVIVFFDDRFRARNDECSRKELIYGMNDLFERTINVEGWPRWTGNWLFKYFCDVVSRRWNTFSRYCAYVIGQTVKTIDLLTERRRTTAVVAVAVTVVVAVVLPVELSDELSDELRFERYADLKWKPKVLSSFYKRTYEWIPATLANRLAIVVFTVEQSDSLIDHSASLNFESIWIDEFNPIRSYCCSKILIFVPSLVSNFIHYDF